MHVTETNLPPVEWADSDAVKVGDWVLALGYPFGVGYSASSGIISALNRSTAEHNSNAFESFLQTDAAINPGNSGGPMVNLHGRVIGVNANIYTPNRIGANVGIGFAIPAKLARRVIDDLIEDGQVDRTIIGVQFVQPKAALLEAERHQSASSAHHLGHAR